MALAFAAGVDVVPVAEHGVVVVRAAGSDVFAGAEYVAVCGAVDGQRGADDLVAFTGAERAVTDLREAGVLVDRDPALPAAAPGWWHAAGAAPAPRVSVSIDVVGDVDAGPVCAALHDAGIEQDAAGTLRVVLTDDYLRDELAEHNERALDEERPWLLAMPGAVEAWLGPLVVPDRGPCWECLAQRIRRQRPLDHYLQAAVGRPVGTPRGIGSIPSTERAVAGMLATTVLRWGAARERAGLHERVLSVDTTTWATRTHTVVRRPQCAACGVPDPPERPAAAPPALAARGEAHDGGGSLRAVSAHTTLDRYAHHVSPISGAVNRLVRASGLRPPLHAYLGGDPGPRRFGDDGAWKPGAANPPGGKGASDEQARVGALCEALERWSGVFGGEEARRVASLEELGDAGVHPNAVMGFSETQYAERDRPRGPDDSFRTAVPAPFDPAAEVAWTPLWSLTAGRERWLPTAFCFYDAHVPGHDRVVAESNGNAAGNTLDEAILQGLLELVERDHVALWWYNRLRLPGLDLAAFADPWLVAVRDLYAEEGRDLWALDLTADIGIPAVAAVASAAAGDDRDAGVALGFGAHLDLGRALERAVSELVQLNAGVPSGGLGARAAGPAPQGDGEYLLAADHVPLRTPDDAPFAPTGDLRADLDAAVAAVEAKGLEVMVLDQTRPDIGLPVVKVVVPGLRHFWRRLGPGRLYDVPVALGLRASPAAEEELNPVPPGT